MTESELEAMLARTNDIRFKRSWNSETTRLVQFAMEAMELLNASGGLVKLVSQNFVGISWTHSDGSSVNLVGVPELLAKIESTLRHYHGECEGEKT